MAKKLHPRKGHYITLPDSLKSNPTTQSDNTRIGQHKEIKEGEYKPGVAAESEELYSYIPILGDAMDVYKVSEDITNKRYLNAGIGLGLLFLPNIIEKPIKLLRRSIKGKIGDYFKFKHISADKSLNSGNTKISDAEQDAAYLRGFKDMFNLFGSKKGNEYVLNPKIQQHYERIGITPSSTSNFNFDRDLDISSYNPNSKEITVIKPTSLNTPNLDSKRDLIRTFGEKRNDRAGTAKFDGLNMSILRRDPEGRLESLQQIYETGLHEAGHIARNLYDIILNDSKGVLSKTLNNDIKTAVEKTLPTSGWASKLEELRADIWAKRVSLGIGDKEISEEIAENLLNDPRIKRHFREGFDKESAKYLIRYSALAGLILNLKNDVNSNRRGAESL